MAHFTKKQSFGGFTLIELLTVIAVIGILAGILVPVVGGARFTAQKANARAEYANIAAALSAFQLDYGYYPMADSAKNGVIAFVTGNGTGQVDLVTLLSGKDAAGNITNMNPRGKQYMQFSENNLTGKDFPVDEQDQFIDSLGNTAIAIVIAPDGEIETNDYKDLKLTYEGKEYAFTKALPNGKVGRFLIYGVGKTTSAGKKVEFVTYPALTTAQSTVP